MNRQQIYKQTEYYKNLLIATVQNYKNTKNIKINTYLLILNNFRE
jgi:hypothetical protein